MTTSPLAGKPAPQNMLINTAELEHEFYTRKPALNDLRQLVAFGTSGHRGTPSDGSFTALHIRAISAAICEYRKSKNITGPLFMGKDTHALSGPAQKVALEVLTANGVLTIIQENDLATPTPVISRAILEFNRQQKSELADGIVITPSHNPPADGGFKYNPPNGGPADTDVTGWIQDRANQLLAEIVAGSTKTTPLLAGPGRIKEENFTTNYVRDLSNVVDMDCIRAAKLKLGVDPLGGASLHYWEAIREAYALDLTIVNNRLDPTFGFMPVDHDGKIRMDCSSPYAMTNLVKLKDQYQVSFGNDPDSDRHGVVARSAGLMNPNHFLAVAIHYLLNHRPKWPSAALIGKTVVSSSLIDRVVKGCGRKIFEVPVGFKFFAQGLFDGSCCFGGEESAGASFLRQDGKVWTTDKDGIILCLLAAEITARTGKDPGEYYEELTRKFGRPYFTRIDAPAGPEQKAKLKKLSPQAITESELAGYPILEKLAAAPGNDAPIGGLKIVSSEGWFAARPSGTEDIYKIYAESFVSEAHLSAIVEKAQQMVGRALK